MRAILFIRIAKFNRIPKLHVNRSQTVSKELSFKPVENKDVQELLDLLITSSREFMQKNYKVSSEEITQKMIDEAQRDIDSLSRIEPGTLNSLYYFNSKLEELFTDIPRKMGRVADYLAHTEADFSRIFSMSSFVSGSTRPR